MSLGQAWCHISVIPTTWEAEIRRIRVWGQPKQKFRETPIPTNKLSIMVRDCNPSCAGGISRRITAWG
jgi:hypothetical protein